MIDSVNAADRLIDRDPAELCRAIRAGEMSAGTLTHVAELMGNRGCPGAYPLLWELLDHKRSIVREGAIYGLSYWIAGDNTDRERFLARMTVMAEADPSPGVRSTARDVIEEID